MDPILRFLVNGELLEDKKGARMVRREVAKYVAIQGQLYKRGFDQPLLKCLRPEQTDYVLSEGCYGHHIGGKALARKLVRAGYYWSSMMSYAQEFVRKYNGTQFANKKFGEFLSRMGIKQKFSSVEHPWSNGQVEAANKVILHSLKK
ncbi:uncharacterized protein LOC107633866 [Arachis ipaensis]|uniref:uncharacterized protein LOC107633866 n=1 Tax=Arachis ipaensis TaxID=130454 RepID=UPI0007AF8E3C|nr:uncharacterized protein LOC107633866 [Arachis ipaensis]XP_025640931.1 uncharacterized protein LOC112735620 [Arachis hypogaea]